MKVHMGNYNGHFRSHTSYIYSAGYTAKQLTQTQINNPSINSSLKANMQATTARGLAISDEIFLKIIKELIRAERPISSRSFSVIFFARAIKAAKITGWFKDVVSLFYKENTVLIVVPSGLGNWGSDQKYLQCPGLGVSGHSDQLTTGCKKCQEYENWYPAAGVASKIQNLEVSLSCYLQSNNYMGLTLPCMFGGRDHSLGLFFSLKDPRFDQQGMDMPPLVRYTRTAWQDSFEHLDNLKVVVDVDDDRRTGTLCLAQASNNGQLSQLGQLKASVPHVYVKLRPNCVEVECRVRAGCMMSKCECGCFEEFARVIASTIEQE